MDSNDTKDVVYDSAKNGEYGERRGSKFVEGKYVGAKQQDSEEVGGETLKRALHGRHMQMIAIGEYRNQTMSREQLLK